jgi:hypothetical protein
MNHELGASASIVRDHGSKGAFVSKRQIRKADLKVLNGEDLFVETDGVAFTRFCSAGTPKRSAF